MNDWPDGWYRDEPRQRGSGQVPPTAAGSGRAAWPEQPSAHHAPGRPAPGRATPGRREQPGPGAGRRRRFWGQPGHHGRRIALIAGAVVVILILAVVTSYFYLDSKLNRSVALPAYSGQSAGTNWLIAGSDTRQGLSRTEQDLLHVGSDVGTTNSDSLMLLHTGGGKPVLISIPRDSYVSIPGHGMNKINAALGFGGPTLLIQTVEQVTGLRIDHYMGIGFGNEDLQREQDQRAFLKALLSKATSPGVYLNPFVALPFGSTAASSTSIDQGTHLYNLVSVALALRNPQTGTVPIADANYPTENAGDAVLWNRSEALQLFKALQNNQPVPANLLSGTQVG